MFVLYVDRWPNGCIPFGTLSTSFISVTSRSPKLESCALYSNRSATRARSTCACYMYSNKYTDIGAGADAAGSSRDEGEVFLQTVNFENALAHALRCLESSDLILKPQPQGWCGRVFVLLPTGFGKSIIYEILPFLFDYKLGRLNTRIRSLVVVVSPLLSLMADQMSCLRHRGARAAMLSSRCASIDKSILATESDMCTYSFLFASPEALITSKWREIVDCRGEAE